MTDMPTPRFIYLFDPLCGWCYGAAPGLQQLMALAGDGHVRLQPVGLFAWDQARSLAGMAAHIRTADERIATLTGQPFSEAYFDAVIGAAGGMLDSGPATQALFAAEQAKPGSVAPLLAAIQAARWREGRDIMDRAVLDAIAQALGLPPLASESHAAKAGAQAWAAQGAQLLQQSGAQGVPTLLRLRDGRAQTVPTDYLYQGRDRLAELLAV